MTNKTTPKLTAAQERAWDIIVEWYEQYGQNGSDTFYALSSRVPMHSSGVPVSDATLAALAKKGLLINHGKARPGSLYGYARYAIHPDYIPTVDAAPEPAPAAAPAPVNNAPVYHTVLLPDTFVAFQAREDIEIVRHNSKKDEDGTLIYVDYRVKATAQPAPVEPEAKFKVGDEVYLKDNPQKRVIGTVNPDGTYGLRTMSGGTGWTDYTADQLTPARDASIPFADMNAYERIIMAAAETNARLEARVKELEGDMERLAASELELVQQNALLNSVVDRLNERTATLENAVHDACAEYGGDMADDAMHTLADTIGYPWN